MPQHVLTTGPAVHAVISPSPSMPLDDREDTGHRQEPRCQVSPARHARLLDSQVLLLFVAGWSDKKSARTAAARPGLFGGHERPALM